MNDARLFRLLGYATFSLLAGIIVMFFNHELWPVLWLSSIPFVALGVATIWYGKSTKRFRDYLFIGIFIIAMAVVADLVFVENDLPKSFQGIADVLLVIFGGVLLGGGTGSLLMFNLHQSATFWRLRGSAGEQKLLDYLQSPTVFVRREVAARLLGETKSEAAFEPLLAALDNEKDAVLRAEAARALGLIGDPRALPRLERMVIEDDGKGWNDKPIKKIAAQAIKHIAH